MPVVESKIYDKIFEESKKNRQWFEENHEKLLSNYSDEFVAIWSREVIAHDREFEKLLDKIPLNVRGKGLLTEYITKEKIEFIL